MFSMSAIETTQETLQTLLNAIPNPMFLIDRDHRLVLVNDAFCDLIGQPRDRLLYRTDYPVPDEQKDVFFRVDEEVFSTGKPNENEELTTTSSGELRIILTRKRLIHLPTKEGPQPFILASSTDVTRFREAESRAQYLAEHDALTGLANRNRLNHSLSNLIEVSGRSRHQAALLLVDLDGFKAVNDQHGHPVGDELLRIVAKRLASLVRSVDTVARFGGDEFCIVLGRGDQPEGAFALAERITSSLAQPIHLDELHLCVSASIGIAIYPEDGDTAETLIQRADKALYQVKRAGRCGYLRYNANAPHATPAQWDIEADLRTALVTEQLSLAFQPLVSAADGSLRGFEALARWSHPVHGPVEPDLFIPAAESSGLIHPLGAWVLHRACAEAVNWPWPVQVSVNISPTQLESGNLVTAVRAALESSGLPSVRLELEITETALMGNCKAAATILNELRSLGISIALDDFGSGWSSLAKLQDFQFDRIKIDRSFIAGIDSDTRSLAIVRTVLSLAQTLNVQVTAEGVEGPSQLVALKHLGCDEFQGFYIGEPQPRAKAPVSAIIEEKR